MEGGEGDIVKIEFFQSGGFSGLSKKIEIDVSLLEDEEAKIVKELLEKSDFFNLKEVYLSEKTDDEIFLIKVENKECFHTVRANRSVLPESLKPLANFLSKKATYVKREKR